MSEALLAVCPECRSRVESAMRAIEQRGRGVLVYVDRPRLAHLVTCHRGTCSDVRRLTARVDELEQAADIAADMLAQLGVRSVAPLNEDADVALALGRRGIGLVPTPSGRAAVSVGSQAEPDICSEEAVAVGVR
jgi:GTP cyclohydrolase II